MNDKDNTRVKSADSKTAVGSDEIGRVFQKFNISLTDQSSGAFAFPALDEAVKGDDEDRQILAQTEPIDTKGTGKLDVSRADLLLLRLQTLRDLVTTAGDPKALAQEARAQQRVAEQVLDENMTAILREQRPLEKSLREVDQFFQLARQNPNDTNLPVWIVNCSLDELRKNNALFESFSAQVPRDTAFSLTKNYSIFALPGWLRTAAAMKKFGELAQQAKGMVFTDLVDAPDFETVAQMFEPGGALAGLKGQEDWKGQVVLVGNHIRVREATRWEKGLGDVYISPSMLLAAQVFHGDDTESLARAQAGDDCKLVVDTDNDIALRPRWDLTDRKQAARLQDCVIPVVWRGDNKFVFWGCETLSDEQFSKQYTVRRVQEFIEKCVLEYLNGRAFTPNDVRHRDQFRDRLSEFLRKNSGPDKMLQGGEVVQVSTLVDDAGNVRPDAMDIKLRLVFKFTTKNFVVETIQSEETLSARGAEGGGWAI